jgi:hypothetical protein
MKIKDYHPKTEEEAVGWLMEEACEVVISIGRCMRFGIENVHEGRTNRDILLDEMNDLRNALFESETWIARK